MIQGDDFWFLKKLIYISFEGIRTTKTFPCLLSRDGNAFSVLPSEIRLGQETEILVACDHFPVCFCAVWVDSTYMSFVGSFGSICRIVWLGWLGWFCLVYWGSGEMFHDQPAPQPSLSPSDIMDFSGATFKNGWFDR